MNFSETLVQVTANKIKTIEIIKTELANSHIEFSYKSPGFFNAETIKVGSTVFKFRKDRVEKNGRLFCTFGSDPEYVSTLVLNTIAFIVG